MASAPRAALTAVASYLPEGLLTNEMLEAEFPDWPASKILDKTGIETRHVAARDEFASDMGIAAARSLFERDERTREGIDYLLFVSATPDYLVPPTACRVQNLLELPTSVGAIDVNHGCSGFTYGLEMAAALVESGRCRKVLLITSTRLTSYTELAYHGSKTLLGDGATACIVEDVADAPRGLLVRASTHGTDGRGERDIIVPTSAMRGFEGDETTSESKPTFVMDGPKVFQFALRVVPGRMRAALDECGLTREDIDHFVFHQANAFMLEHLRRRLRIPRDKFVLRIADVGNTGGSSIPLALDEALQEERIASGQRVLLVSFGTGYSWGTVLLESA